MKDSQNDNEDCNEQIDLQQVFQKELEKIKYILSKDNRSVLIILDQAEDLLRKDKEQFKSVLKQILDSCQFVKILCSSKEQMGWIGGSIKEEVVELDKFSDKVAV